MWEIESRFSWNYSAIASSSSCQLGYNFSDPAQNSVLSGRRLFGTMDATNPPRWLRFRRILESVNTSATMPQRPMDIKLAHPSLGIVSLQRIADSLSLI